MNKFFLIFNIIFSSFIISCTGKIPATISQFAICPEKPNCVSTKNINTKSYIHPISYNGSTENAKRVLLETINSFESVKIKKELEYFIHVEFTSKIFKFVDDVEFYLKEPGKIHFRSASRIGYSDLGVNRERMETIRKNFNKLYKSHKN